MSQLRSVGLLGFTLTASVTADYLHATSLRRVGGALETASLVFYARPALILLMGLLFAGLMAFMLRSWPPDVETSLVFLTGGLAMIFLTTFDGSRLAARLLPSERLQGVALAMSASGIAASGYAGTLAAITGLMALIQNIRIGMRKPRDEETL